MEEDMEKGNRVIESRETGLGMYDLSDGIKGE